MKLEELQIYYVGVLAPTQKETRTKAKEMKSIMHNIVLKCADYEGISTHVYIIVFSLS